VVSSRHRVLHLLDDMRLGGSQRVVISLSDHQVEAGLGVAIAAQPHGELWARTDRGVRRVAAPPHRGVLRKLRYTAWLRRTVRALRVDVVHAHQRQVALLAQVAVLGSGTAVVEHVHSTFRATWTSRLLSFRAHHLIACGSSVGRMLIDDFRRPRARVSVVRNAVADPGGDHDQDPPAPGAAALRIVGVGRLDEVKNPQLFVEVVRGLRAAGYPVAAEWVGDGPLLPVVEDDLRRDPVPGLRFSGAAADVASRIRGADLLLLTSRHEGLPLVVLEAMSLGRAVVCSDVGSCRDVVRDRVNGVVYPLSHGPDEVAGIIGAAYDDGVLADWGANSRKLFVELGGTQEMAQQVLTIYESVVGSGRRPRRRRGGARLDHGGRAGERG
jgi:glycosyltransferase involved in cell wall biosynthesis